MQFTTCTVMASALFLMAACGSEKDTGTTATNEAEATPQANTVPASISPSVRVGGGSGSIQFGDDKFELDVIICVGTSKATAIASDSQRRAGYPVVTIKVFDPDTYGDMMTDSVFVLIDRDDYQEQWKMQNGNVSRNGDVYTAYGAFEGSQMVEQEDGTMKRVRLEGISYMPFQTRIECE